MNWSLRQEEWVNKKKKSNGESTCTVPTYRRLILGLRISRLTKNKENKEVITIEPRKTKCAKHQK